MLGYYGLDNLDIERLPAGSRNIKDNIYEICCPLIVKKISDLPDELLCLYKMLEIPIYLIDEVDNFMFEEDTISEYLKDFSYYLKLNIGVEMLEESQVGHLLRVGKKARDLCVALELPAEEIKTIYMAAIFHDIGKSKIPGSIVGKKGKLNSLEYETIKKHSIYSYNILKDFLEKDVLAIIKSHHERCDGSGYPDGIIPNLGAKIVGIVDSYDAMISKRIYQDEKSKEAAYQELMLCSLDVSEGGKGKLFDSKLVSKFIEADSL